MVMVRMMQLGTVVNIAYNGSLIVNMKDANTIPVNKVVADQMGNDVGRIVEIIGPVRSPYAVVKPFNKSMADHTILGKELILNPKDRVGERNGRRLRRKRKKSR